MDVRAQLREMGFPAGMIEAAVRNSAGNLESAIEWIEEKQSQGGTEQEEDLTTDNQVEQVEETKKSFTPEEREAKLNVLREKAAVRKAEQAKEDAKNERRNEELRKKKDLEWARLAEEQKKQEALKEAAKRRQEARDDVAAKRRIKDLIEADKLARRAEKEKAAGISQAPSSPAAELTKPAKPSQPRQLPNESKIRFRLPGSPQLLTKTYGIDSTVNEVLVDIAQACSCTPDKVQLRLTFPTRIISSVDSNKTVKEVDLINTSVTVVLS